MNYYKFLRLVKLKITAVNSVNTANNLYKYTKVGIWEKSRYRLFHVLLQH